MCVRTCVLHACTRVHEGEPRKAAVQSHKRESVFGRVRDTYQPTAHRYSICRSSLLIVHLNAITTAVSFVQSPPARGSSSSSRARGVFAVAWICVSRLRDSKRRDDDADDEVSVVAIDDEAS